jgi:hypothetical protein
MDDLVLKTLFDAKVSDIENSKKLGNGFEDFAKAECYN